MEWRPFKHIIHEKRASTLPFFFLFLVGGLGIPLSYYVITRDSNSYYFTTTVDIENRQILDRPIALRETPDGIKETVAFAIHAFSTVGKDTENLLMLASPSVKYVNIRPGLRREEVAEAFAVKVGWDEKEKQEFIHAPAEHKTKNLEGYYFPGSYPAVSDMSPDQASGMMLERFDQEVSARHASSSKKVINLETALKIASLIEREAGSKSDMRLISGIIWNRIFATMNLQIDATLQYVKGTEDNGWWPKVLPSDKFLDSPYNTYQNSGLTPSPIANPSLAAIQAALNPVKTKCMFYLHDKNKRIHCAANYEDHVRNIRRWLN